MKRFFIAIIVFFTYQTQIQAQMDTMSYSMGMMIAKNLQSQGISELDIESFNAAILDVLGGKTLAFSLEEANSNVQTYMKAQQEKMSKGVIDEGKKFLTENGKREGVHTTDTGLQYEVLTPGTGTVSPGPTDKVNVHYHGSLLDGTVFDSSVDRGEPISFPLNGVISGWTEGLQLMTEGAKYRFYIPYDLAYGSRGAGAKIKPYATLIFDVELLNIE